MTTYLAGSAQQHVADAESLLGAHLLNPDTGRCRECGQFAPCEQANDVFALLHRYRVAVPAVGTPNGADRPKVFTPTAPLMTLAAWIRTTRADRRRDPAQLVDAAGRRRPS